VSGSSVNIAKQIKMIADANLENSQSTSVILQRLQQIREVSRNNGESAKTIERMLGKSGAVVEAVKPGNGRSKPAAVRRARPGDVLEA